MKGRLWPNREVKDEVPGIVQSFVQRCVSAGKNATEKAIFTQKPSMRSWSALLQIEPEVREALENKQAVVALESTIISHGMPYPDNVETALLVERTVREHGAVPATLAIAAGRLQVGLPAHRLEELGKAGPRVIKCSRRDIPFVLTRGELGATTVAATMILADLAGIRLFATGGIGGVHRGAELSMDISADLQELARTDVAVVSAGAKAILDLELTREYLETMGVPVIGFGADEWPAFYTRHSGLPVDYRYDQPAALAKALHVKWSTPLPGGVLIANPIPEEEEMEYAPVREAIEKALAEAAKKGIRGKEVTPFLLARIVELTGGDSLRANVALVRHNARLAAQLAVEYAALRPG